MKKIEKMISIKDASYIKDMFDWNIVAAKKYDEYLNNVEDEDIATLFNKCADMHYKICDKLIKIMEDGENND